MTVRLGSLCSGAGMLDLAVESVFDAAPAWHAENDPAAARVLAHRRPGVPNYGDLTALDWATVEPVDVLAAGFPCQPISYAGRRKVTADERWIWPAIAHAVRVLRPRHVLLENVPPLLRPWRDDDGWWNPAPVEEVAGDLAGLGYVGRWRCLRAADVGAPHERQRVFIAATDALGAGLQGPGPRPRRRSEPARAGAPAPADADGQRFPGRSQPDGEALGSRLGAPRRVDADGLGEIVAEYRSALRRWERVLGRPAPPPLDDARHLSPPFVEWMMGLPAGWVTAVPGISRTGQLRILGNGVVPQCAAAAYAGLLADLTTGAAA